MDFGSNKTTVVIIGAVVLYLVTAPWIRAHVHQPTPVEYHSHLRVRWENISLGNALEDAYYGVGQYAHRYDTRGVYDG